MAQLPVYSTRFLAWAAEELPPVFEVPNGYVAVIRHIDVVSGGGAMINWVAGINQVCKIACGQFTIEALNQLLQWDGHAVLNAGDQLYFQSDGPTDGQASGYLLTNT